MTVVQVMLIRLVHRGGRPRLLPWIGGGCLLRIDTGERIDHTTIGVTATPISRSSRNNVGFRMAGS